MFIIQNTHFFNYSIDEDIATGSIIQENNNIGTIVLEKKDTTSTKIKKFVNEKNNQNKINILVA
jgi:hypothetical protein